MKRKLESLDALHVRSEKRAGGRVPSDGWAAHEAVLDRLAANIRLAEARGWTSCAIERLGVGRFCAWGVPPAGGRRHPVPDWLSEHD
jgi:hypothetical protein